MTSINQVSQPPLTSAMVTKDGKLTRPWAIWFRDLYKRTAYKGGNAIDDNAADSVWVVDSIADALAAHEAAKAVHGSNGNVVGFNDLAGLLSAGLVRKMMLVNTAITSTVAVTSATVAASPATYDQTHNDTIISLINELKTDTNQAITDLNLAMTQLNELIAESKAAGQMSET